MITKLILCFHNHQPVGNFGFVLRDAFEKSYKPLVDVLSGFPGIKFYLHFSGFLLEWIRDNEPGYIEKLKALVDRGDLKIINGGYYEPIISNIPRRDALDQFKLYSKAQEKIFGSVSKGAWLAERVWEPTFPSLLKEADVSFTFLDEYHFQYAGINESELTGYYEAEHLNDYIDVLPISKKLRYLMPFHDVQEVMDYLIKFQGPLLTMADDGEKFGLWPGTYELVYKQGWLADLLSAILDSEEVETVHFEDCGSEYNKGRINIPACSYPEMMEWVLPPEGQERLAEVKTALKDEDHVFVKGGFWSNFSVKYPQINVMLRRMLLSSELNKILAPEEKIDLFKGQCNCAYWHGVFGGTYIPHLRHAVFEHLIKQDTFDRGMKSIPGLEPSHDDILVTEDAARYFFSKKGGVIYELDLKGMNRNILSVMERKREYYHSHIDMSDTSGVKTIHDGFYLKDHAVELIYDSSPRYSMKDVVINQGTDHLQLYRNESIIQDLSSENYKMTRGDWTLGFALPGYLKKEISINGKDFSVKNTLNDNLNEGVLVQQWNIAISSGKEQLFYGEAEAVLPCNESADITTDRLFIVDNAFDLKVCFRFPNPLRVIVYPVKTVSNSEAGVEEILQGVSVNIFIKNGEYSVNL